MLNSLPVLETYRKLVVGKLRADPKDRSYPEVHL